MFINTINNFNLNKNNTSQSFKSRNPEIRFADDIARKVNQEFPRLSFSKVLEFSNIDRFQLFAYFLNQKIVAMRSVKSNLYNNAISLSEKLLALTSSIKKFQVGNCGESAQLAEIAARTNGIKDCYCTLLNSQDEIIDHQVLFVYNNGKSYVIDPWLGFADYLPKATDLGISPVLLKGSFS